MAQTDMIGAKITKIRRMTPKELKAEGWEARGVPTAIEFSNGAVLYPSRDEEGNGPGVLFGKQGKSTFYLFAE